ncbi:carbohydrate porin [Aestuariibacter salexigens]|uniref:carbohydrate porin n=1 Tax=Aestuariibacter salexigens TaxID=226010 RepID=UPI000479A9FD|nr:carbohydrate porin [Aestuariibacter salexigens]
MTLFRNSKFATATGLFLITLGVANDSQANDVTVDLINDSSVLLSGENKGNGATRSLASVTYAVEYESWRFVANAQALRGENGSEESGDLQAYSNIDETAFSKLYEIYLQKDVNNGLTLKFGQMDANNDFAFSDNAGEFINSSMGFSPTITFMPTYPLPTLGAAAFININPANSLSAAVFSDPDNQFNERFFISEWRSEFSTFVTKLGMWYQTGEIPTLNNLRVKEGTSGGYLLAEGGIDSSLFASQGSSWFVQLGTADDEVAEIVWHAGAGVVWNAPFQRASDMTGIGISHIETSSLAHAELAESETAFELFYRFQINDMLAIKPDLQLILSPAAAPDRSNAVVFTLRTEISL